MLVLMQWEGDMRSKCYIVALTAGLIATLAISMPARATDCGADWQGVSQCFSICKNGGTATIEGISWPVRAGGCDWCVTAQALLRHECLALQKKELNAKEAAWLRAHLKDTFKAYHGRNTVIKQPVTSSQIRIKKPVTSSQIRIKQPVTSSQIRIKQPVTSSHVGSTHTSVKIKTHAVSTSSSNRSNQLSHTQTMERMNTPKPQIK
jgi:hypothetical protein